MSPDRELIKRDVAFLGVLLATKTNNKVRVKRARSRPYQDALIQRYLLENDITNSWRLPHCSARHQPRWWLRSPLTVALRAKNTNATQVPAERRCSFLATARRFSVPVSSSITRHADVRCPRLPRLNSTEMRRWFVRGMHGHPFCSLVATDRAEEPAFDRPPFHERHTTRPNAQRVYVWEEKK